ncbi:MAG: HAD-IB family phosphatase [Gammaproteobacteria bacterium]|nr:HAD-IB family phosphatase [Gammaproteobacteria bacterium]
MNNFEQHLSAPIDAIAFDCDGTLSKIEGIDECARQNNVFEQVCALTERAMSESGINSDLYQQRLDYVKPSLKQLEALGEQYYQTRSEGVDQVLATFRKLGKAIFIISAGMNPAVTIFAKKLGIPPENVYAVDIFFDSQKRYRDFNRDAFPGKKGGKRLAIKEINKRYPRVMLVGDGMNDVEAADIVTRFVGYGGNYYRENVKQQSEHYIETESLLPLITLGTSEEECERH